MGEGGGYFPQAQNGIMNAITIRWRGESCGVGVRHFCRIQTKLVESVVAPFFGEREIFPMGSSTVSTVPLKGLHYIVDSN